MAFLRRVLGMQSLEEAQAEADALFDKGEFGSAKIAYERALGKAKSAPEETRGTIQSRIEACCDGIARQRLATAEEHVASGELDLASDELEGAKEVAVDPELRAQVQRGLDDLERRHAQQDAPAEPSEEMSHEEKLTLLAGSWEEAQAREYERYGERFEQAVVALHEARGEEARDALEALLADTEDARYLWLEVGRARLLAGDTDGGERAVREFLQRLGTHEGGEARLAAHMELARLADERDEFDAAVAEYRTAIERLGDDPRPYLWLGHFLRLKGHPEEAIEVIESALELLDMATPDWRVLHELGLAQAEAGRRTDAIQSLEQVLDVFTSRRLHELPVDATRTLARLHEEEGELQRAADLFRTLADAHDPDPAGRDHEEAARILDELGMTDEAHRLRQRAGATAEPREAR